MKERIVHLEKKFCYGNCHLYPTNKNAENFCILIGRKTIIPSDFQYIKNLEFKIMIDGNYI